MVLIYLNPILPLNFLGLNELDNYFTAFNLAAKLLPDQPNVTETSAPYFNRLKQSNIEINSFNDLNLVSEYLNQLTETCSWLYIHYQNKLEGKYNSMSILSFRPVWDFLEVLQWHQSHKCRHFWQEKHLPVPISEIQTEIHCSQIAKRYQ